MEIQTIINQINLANYSDQVIEDLVGRINGINLESKSSTIAKLKEYKGKMDNEEKNKTLEDLIQALEK
ncbi:hypothetical protein NMK71_08750 [Weeksellaceae bacterium KMM 9713]|uniref:Uncharacterized protein n=1 Tax=Profundicola chukchiensis TaxID=2961959 RepID=A0A9X4RVB3_9FLAO|nr:hypothetical protein [Profundicola chukchiensis]MDG4946501.1 hypothetical protein [Profundicola chukchiensis]